jgi:hypothetical protein
MIDVPERHGTFFEEDNGLIFDDEDDPTRCEYCGRTLCIECEACPNCSRHEVGCQSDDNTCQHGLSLDVDCVECNKEELA